MRGYLESADAEVDRLNALCVRARAEAADPGAVELDAVIDEPVRVLAPPPFTLPKPNAGSLRAMQNVSSGDKPASKSRAHVDKSAGFVFDEIDPPEIAVKLYSGSGCNGPGVPNDGKGCGNPLLSGVYHYWPTTYNGLSVKPARFTPPDHNPHANKKICELCFNTYKEFEKFTGKRNIEPRIDVHTQTGEDVEAVDTKVASVNAPPRCVFQTNWIRRTPSVKSRQQATVLTTTSTYSCATRGRRRVFTAITITCICGSGAKKIRTYQRSSSGRLSPSTRSFIRPWLRSTSTMKCAAAQCPALDNFTRRILGKMRRMCACGANSGFAATRLVVYILTASRAQVSCRRRRPVFETRLQEMPSELSVRVTLPTGLRIPCSCRQSSALLSTRRATFPPSALGR